MFIPPDHDQNSKEQPSHQQELFFFGVTEYKRNHKYKKCKIILPQSHIGQEERRIEWQAIP